jgi:hypothetical protein
VLAQTAITDSNQPSKHFRFDLARRFLPGEHGYEEMMWSFAFRWPMGIQASFAD